MIIGLSIANTANFELTGNSIITEAQASSTTPTATGTTCNISITTTSNLNLRADTSTATKSLIVIPKGTNLIATAQTSSWYKVSYKGYTGWIYKSYTTGGPPITTIGTSCSDVIKTTANLNLRAEASTSTTSLIVIPKGTQLTATAQTNAWYKVSYSGKTGWIFKEYTTLVSSGTSSDQQNSGSSSTQPNLNIKAFDLEGRKGKTTARLNLRWSDTASSNSLGIIPSSTEVAILKDSILSRWYLAEYNGQKGWVSKEYITLLPATIPTNELSIVKPSTVALKQSGDTFDTSKPKPTKDEVLKMIDKYAAKYNVPAHIFKAVVQVESNFNHQCISSGGAVGLIQLMPVTAREMGLTVDSKTDERWVPEKNIEAGIKYIAKYYYQFNDAYPTKNNESDWDRALAAYNGGPSIIKNNNGVIPNSTAIKSYVNKVNQYKENYR